MTSVSALPAAPDAPRRRPALSPARLGVVLATLAGLAVAVGVVGWFGAGRILASVAAVGPGGFALYAGYSLLTFSLTGGAWWVLAVGQPLRRWPLFAFGRLLREAASDILPFASLGGVVVGTRGLALRGVPAATAYGSLAMELLTEIVAQIAFMVLGFAVLSARLAGDARAHEVELAFAAATSLLALAIAGLVVAQRRGFGLLGRIVSHLMPVAGVGLQGVQEAVGDLYHRPLRVVASVVLHTAGWIASAVASWIALRLMGASLSIPAVIAIESLLSAVKSAAFAVPNAVGVQEAAYALLGQLFGLSGEMGVALSLVRRAKDLALGAPTLLVWQVLEGRRLLGR